MRGLGFWGLGFGDQGLGFRRSIFLNSERRPASFWVPSWMSGCGVLGLRG